LPTISAFCVLSGSYRQKKRLRTFIDESAQHFPNIYVSAGRRGLEVQLEATVLAQLTQAIFAPIGRG